jgi:hypothetical protein
MAGRLGSAGCALVVEDLSGSDDSSWVFDDLCGSVDYSLAV